MSHSSVCPKAKMFNQTCVFFAGPWLSLLILVLAASHNIFGKEHSGKAWKSFHPVTACGSLLAALVIAVGESFGKSYLKRGFAINHSVHLFGGFRNPVLQMLRLHGQT